MDDDEFGAYESLGEDTGDHRWAYGTGFTDPLDGVDTTVPPGVDGEALAAYCLMLGDDALIYSHRLQQWVTRAPELEEETALGNIALDLLGQARLLLTRAGRADGTGRNEDQLAFWRREDEFRNVRMVERLDSDFAELVARLLVFSTWRLALLDGLRSSADPVLSAVAGMGVKELTYHRDYAAQWVVRLGDGTELSHARMQRGLDVVWPLVDELFTRHPVEASLLGVAVDVSTLRPEFDVVLDAIFAMAGLDRPAKAALAGVGGLAGRDGRHTEAMGYILAELQSVARADPGGDVVTAWDVAAAVPDPELPMVTLADLGILRGVEAEGDKVTVTITPTYSGCPAMREISHDLDRRLRRAGYVDVDVRTSLAPPWTSDWITPTGREKLALAGIAPPNPVPAARPGPIPLTLTAQPRVVTCPLCGAGGAALTAAFSGTACKALYRCAACSEPFEYVKEI